MHTLLLVTLLVALAAAPAWAAPQTAKPNIMPEVVNLREDPFERYALESGMYQRWAGDKLWLFVPAQMVVGQFVASFKEFPPSQKSGSFSVDQVLDQLQTTPATGK
jgi:arylsulfatase